MSNQVKGKIKVINDTQTFDSGFQKREFVVTTNETYQQDIKMEFVKDKCGILDTYKVGQDVLVSYNLRGNEYNGKYYVNLNAWRIESGESVEQATQTKEHPKGHIVVVDEPDSDDLPF